MSLVAGSLLKRAAASLSLQVGQEQGWPMHRHNRPAAAMQGCTPPSLPPLLPAPVAHLSFPLHHTPQAAAASSCRAALDALAAQPGSALPACLTLLRRLSGSAAAPSAAAAAAAAAEPATLNLEDLLPAAVRLEEQEVQGLYCDLVVPVYTLDRQPTGETYTLGGDIFDVPIRRDILHRVVRWQLAKAQQGTHKTKTRSEVRGGGRKPRPQKGSGASRQGTIRAPQW